MIEFSLWSVRGSDVHFDPYEEYVDQPSMFTIQVFHGGEFVNYPGRRYASGKMSYLDNIDSDEFSVMEFNVMFKTLGYPDDEVVYYHYKIPGKNLDNGLRALGTDQDVIDMLQYVNKIKSIEVYVEHWVTRLETYFISPKGSSSVVIEEIANADPSDGNLDHLPKARVCSSVSRQLALEWLDTNVGIDTYGKDVQNNDEEYHSDNEDSEDPDYIMDGEDAQDYEYGEHDEHVLDDMVENDNEVEDVMVDKDNEVEEVSVDMHNFKATFEAECLDGEDLDDEMLDEAGTQIDLDDFDSPDDENDHPMKKALKRIRRKNKGLKGVNIPFEVGQNFSKKEDIKKLVTRHALESRRQLVIRLNDKSRFRVVCHGINPDLQSTRGQKWDLTEICGTKKKTKKKEGESSKGETSKLGSSNTLNNTTNKRFPDPTCPWVLHVSRSKVTDAWRVKTFNDEHHCLQTREVRLYTVSSLAREVEEIIVGNPTIPLKALQDQLQKKHQIQLSLQKTFRARVMAVHKLEGDYKAQYSMLREYCEELLRSNPGSTIKIDVERECNPSSPTRQFRRIYICLGALKAGFKMSGREILGLDGCFMKGPFPGQVLTAVGVDANNGIYPVAYSIVEAETTSSWTWFLENLGDDLELDSTSNFTFITDRQKGLIPALARVFPRAEHRYCLRHIHENMKAKWRDNLFKEMLWECACATTIPQFKRQMLAIRRADAELYEWLKQIPPKCWARSHFSGRAKTDVLLNNLCEVFNRQLVEGRDKPIITCLEYIREYLMKRIVIVHKLIAKSDGPLTPHATKTFNAIKVEASQYSVMMAGKCKFQVSGPYMDQCAVDVNERTCSCRKWQLTGMPCKHAVAAIWDMARNGFQVGIVESWVDEVYWYDTWKKVYMNCIEPINGREFWTPSECPTSLTPPKHHTQIGRPKKKRKKSAFEIQEVVKNGKLSRKGTSKTCGKCGNQGHNSRSCKGQGGEKTKSGKKNKVGKKRKAGNNEKDVQAGTQAAQQN